MSWNNKKPKLLKYKNKKYSIINKLKAKNLISEQTLNNINNLALEDIVAVKLELTTRYICGKLYGLPLWRVTRHTVTDALLKTALSISKTKKEGARFLGINYTEFNKLLKKYNTVSFFEDGGETVSTKDE